MAKTQQRPKCQSCGKGWCQNHIFELVPRSKHTHLRKMKKIRMCPRFSKDLQKFIQIVPIFNKDRKFYTPCFILEEEQNLYVDNDGRYKASHAKRASQRPSGLSQILVPKHGSKNKFCNVCRDSYQDYLEHIESIAHKQCAMRNKYTVLIKQLCRNYREESLRLQYMIPSVSAQGGLEQSTQTQNLRSKVESKDARADIRMPEPRLNNI